MKFALFLLCALLVTPSAFAAGLTVEKAWIRQAIPGTDMAAGYLTLRNSGKKPVTIRSISCETVASTEMHRSFDKNGQTQMEHLPTLTLKAGQSLTFAEGGHHLMLMGLSREWQNLEKLRCAINGKTVLFEAEVRDEAEQHDGAAHNHHH